MKKLFIISSTAGNSELSITSKEIYQVYKNHNKENQIEIIETNHQNHAFELSKDFVRKNEKDKLIIVCGGDGTLNEVANAIYGTDTALGLIPTGTGNDFSKNFNYSNFSIEDTIKADIKPIDLIKVNNRICINIMSLGFDTEVLANAYKFLEKKPILGKKAYLKAVLYSLKNINYENLEIELNLSDNSKINLKGDYLISALCNGSFYGSGFNPAPEAKIDDGILNLVLAKKIPFISLLPLILKYKSGKHSSSKYLEEYKVVSGIIKSPSIFKANVDGEIFESDIIEFSIIKDAINWAYFKNK